MPCVRCDDLLKWFTRWLHMSIFTGDRLKAILCNTLNDIAQSRRDGSDVVDAMNTILCTPVEHRRHNNGACVVYV